MNLNSIKSILTLRYDYTQTPILPKLTWQDLSQNEDYSHLAIENQLILNFKNKIPKNYSKPISISLSGGIDSSLMLCLLKQIFLITK